MGGVPEEAAPEGENGHAEEEMSEDGSVDLEGESEEELEEEEEEEEEVEGEGAEGAEDEAMEVDGDAAAPKAVKASA